MGARRSGSVMKRLQRGGLLGVAAGAALMALAGPAVSGGAAVTQGDFHAFSAAAGSELSIGGHAQMVRTADGKTKVSINVTGLTPGEAYDSHVHAGSCATNATGGGHYFFSGPIPDGDGPGANEIWPGPVAPNRGGVGNGNTTVGATAGPTATAVVVHREGSAPNKIACADLS
jgi:hypothetical protein